MKRYLIMFSAFAMSLSAGAAVLSPQEAFDAACRKGDSHSALLRNRTLRSAVPMLTLKAGGEPTLYVFSDEKGCIVASAESETQALLGYVDTPVASESDMPEAMRYWLDYYSNEIRQLREGKVIHRIVAADEDFASVEPFVQTKWNQSAPYNNLCPMLDTKRSVTGCVATAMAQAMKVYNWPAQGRNEISYRWSTGGETLSLDFSESVYDWDQMLNVYDSQSTQQQQDAVATLMRDCGYSVRMNYSPWASGASSMAIALGLYTYFDYDHSMEYQERSYFFNDEWAKMIYSDIAAGRPVLYCGSGFSGGHCFIADGYSSDGFFHFNWGWGGASDGYFLLSALAPGSQGIGGNNDNFNSNQSIVHHLIRPEEGSKLGVVLASDRILNTQRESYSAGASIRFGGAEVTNFSVESVSGTVGVKLIPDHGDPVYVAGTTNVSVGTLYDSDSSFTTFKVPVDNMPESGEFLVEPALFSDGEWYDVEMSCLLPARLACEISDGEVTFFHVNAEAQLDVTDFEITTPLYSGEPFQISFEVSNPGTEDYYGDLVMLLYRGDSGVTNTSYFNVNLPVGESKKQDVIASFYGTPSPGNYSVYLTNSLGYIAVGPLDVTIEEAPEEIAEAELSDLKVTNATSTSTGAGGDIIYSVNPSEIKIEGKVTCTQGYLTDAIYAYLYNVTGGSALASMGRSYTLLGSGTSGTAVFEGSYPQATDGKEYMVAFFLRNDQMPVVLYIKADSSTSVSMVEAEKANFVINGDTLHLIGVSENVRARVYSSDGTLVVESCGENIDLGKAKSGVYMIIVNDGDKFSVAKLIR